VCTYASLQLIFQEDIALVLASDGLWDELKNAKVMDLLYKHQASAKSACDAIARAVLKKCHGAERKPNDDLTVFVVAFLWQ
jgi:serine/threonine protein phosphatase PrpC